MCLCVCVCVSIYVCVCVCRCVVGIEYLSVCVCSHASYTSSFFLLPSSFFLRCDQGVQLETGLIRDQLITMNKTGFLTINSQPRVNGAVSTDSTFGWGGPGGRVYVIQRTSHNVTSH